MHFKFCSFSLISSNKITSHNPQMVDIYHKVNDSKLPGKKLHLQNLGSVWGLGPWRGHIPQTPLPLAAFCVQLMVTFP